MAVRILPQGGAMTAPPDKAFALAEKWQKFWAEWQEADKRAKEWFADIKRRRALIREYPALLYGLPSGRKTDILKKRLLEDRSLESLATEYRVSRGRIQQIETEGFCKLRGLLGSPAAPVPWFQRPGE